MANYSNNSTSTTSTLLYRDSRPMASDNYHQGGYAENSFGDRYWAPGSGVNYGHADRIDRILTTGTGSSSARSPAVSALGLLAFLFFLNMIQNSLVTNSLMTTQIRRRRNRRTTISPAAAAMMMGGTDKQTTVKPNRIIRYGRKDIETGPVDIEIMSRGKRSFEKDVRSEHFERIILNENPGELLALAKDKVQKIDPVPILTPAPLYDHVEEVESQIESPILLTSKKNGTSEVEMATSKRSNISKKCLQLMACRLGRWVHTALGGVVSQLVGLFVIPKSKFLSSSVHRALSNGWSTKKSCSHLYKRCKLNHSWSTSNLKLPQKDIRLFTKTSTNKLIIF